MTETPPSGLYEAAHWLADRHEWVRYLVNRVVPNGVEDDEWPGVLAGTMNEERTLDAAWAEYERTHREPPRTGDEDVDDRAWEAWRAAGPQGTASLRAFGPMSSGEKRALRMLATLGGTVPWSADDVASGDERARAVTEDWLAILRVRI